MKSPTHMALSDSPSNGGKRGKMSEGGKCQKGANVRRGQMSEGGKCQRGQMSEGANVRGGKCQWGQMSERANVNGGKCLLISHNSGTWAHPTHSKCLHKALVCRYNWLQGQQLFSQYYDHKLVPFLFQIIEFIYKLCVYKFSSTYFDFRLTIKKWISYLKQKQLHYLSGRQIRFEAGEWVAYCIITFKYL